VNLTPLVAIDGKNVKPLDVVQTYKYLGLQARPYGMRKAYGDFLRVGLDRLTGAPLKSQQRMFLLRCNLMPKMYHGLVLGEMKAKSLEQLDKQVRAAVRKWLCLPHDTHTAFGWVMDGSALLSGWDYIQSVILRGNLPPSAERMSRGRRQAPVLCDKGCNAQGNLVHTSQSCTRTHRLWCDRHDSVLGLIIEKIESRGHEVIRELSIPTGEGRRKLDLVAQVDSVAHVVDVTITSDCNDTMRGKKSAIMRDSMPSTGLRKFFWAAV